MLYQELDASDLKSQFEMIHRDYFSIDACDALVEVYRGCVVEFDGIKICGEFSEEYPAEILERYSCLDRGICLDDEGNIDIKWFMLELQEHTFARYLNNGKVLYMDF